MYVGHNPRRTIPSTPQLALACRLGRPASFRGLNMSTCCMVHAILLRDALNQTRDSLLALAPRCLKLRLFALAVDEAVYRDHILCSYGKIVATNKRLHWKCRRAERLFSRLAARVASAEAEQPQGLLAVSASPLLEWLGPGEAARLRVCRALDSEVKSLFAFELVALRRKREAEARRWTLEQCGHDTYRIRLVQDRALYLSHQDRNMIEHSSCEARKRAKAGGIAERRAAQQRNRSDRSASRAPSWAAARGRLQTARPARPKGR